MFVIMIAWVANAHALFATADEFLAQWSPCLLIAMTILGTALVCAAAAFFIYNHKKRKLGKQVADRVEYITKTMMYGYVGGTVHPTIEDVYQTGNYVHLNGVKCLDCHTTSYLKLDMLPEVKEKAKEMIDRYGSARCVTQMYFKLPLINQLVQQIESVTSAHVLIASSVTSGHFAVIPVLVGANFANLMVLDRRVHNSVSLAAQVCQGNKSIRCDHNDMTQLEGILKRNRFTPAVWYFCDGIYSMSGVGAPVAQLLDLMRRYPNLHIYCDDAHGSLWYHNAGFFIGEMLRLGAAVTEFGSRLVVALALGKCYASGGGAFVFSGSKMRHIVLSCGPTMTFNTVINPAELGAAVHITDMALLGCLTEPRARLLRLIEFREREVHALPLVKSGIMIPTRSISPIAVIYFKHSPDISAILQTFNWIDGFGFTCYAAVVTDQLRETGFLVNITAFPAVALKEAGIRFAIHSEMSEEEILSMLQAIESAVCYANDQFLNDRVRPRYEQRCARVFEELEYITPSPLKEKLS